MADAYPNRGRLLLRFAGLSLFGLVADALLLHLLLNVMPGPLAAGSASLFAALGIMLLLLRGADLTAGNTLSIGRPGITAILAIAAVLNYGLYAMLITALPSVQPLAAMALASATSLCFAVFGYIRFAFRE
jgi:hypothetical protein